MTDDVIARAQPFLNVCGSCDAGLPMSCTCPIAGDFRPVMGELVREVERLRAELRPIPDGPHCPRCGSPGMPLGAHGICVPCAAVMGWAPECSACLVEGRGEEAQGLAHVRTCGPGQQDAT